MTLEEIKKQLQENRESTDDTTLEVMQLTDLMEKQFLKQDRQRLDDLEDKRESKKTSDQMQKAGQSSTTGGNPFGDLEMLGNVLRSLFSPLGIAALASLTGADTAIRALKIPDMIKGVRTFFTNIADYFDKIRKIQLPKIELIGGSAGRFKLPLPEIPTPRFVTATGDLIEAGKNFLDIKIKTPAINFVDDVGQAIDKIKLKIPKIPDIKIPEIPTPKFVSASVDFVKNIELELPKLPQIKIGEGDFSFIQKLKDILGNFPDGANDVAGKGILGFIGSAAKVLEPVLKPIKFIMRTVLRPFTQILLSVIDFVIGFYKGFTNEAEDEMSTFSDKLLAGVEGGFLGVIKGITEAFDLLFFTIPSWLLEKFGMTNVADILRGFSLTELVDPIWNGIKNTVTFVGDNFMLMKDIISGFFALETTRIVNGFKKAFETVANFVNNLGDELYLLIAKNLRFKLDPMVITNPITGNPLFTIPGFNAGIGTAETIAAAEERITNRNTTSAAKIEGLNNEVAEMMKAQQARLDELSANFQNQVLVAPNNSQVNQNNNTTVLNNSQMPDSVAADPIFN
jgi:DNA-binding transcriptional MerR regulator